MNKTHKHSIAGGVIVTLVGVIVSFFSPAIGISICVLAIGLAWWWGWGRDWLGSRWDGKDVPPGYRKAHGVHWGVIGADFDIDSTDLDNLSGVFNTTFALTSDEERQPTNLLILCSDPVRKVSAKLEHVIGAGFPLNPVIRGEKSVVLEFAEHSFGPIPTKGMNGSLTAPIDQTIHLTVGFEMNPPEKRRNEILDIYERS